MRSISPMRPSTSWAVAMSVIASPARPWPPCSGSMAATVIARALGADLDLDFVPDSDAEALRVRCRQRQRIRRAKQPHQTRRITARCAGDGGTHRRRGDGVDAEQRHAAPADADRRIDHRRGALKVMRDAQLRIDRVWDRAAGRLDLMRGRPGHLFHGQPKPAPGALVGQVHGDHDRDTERDADDRQPGLPAVARQIAPAGRQQRRGQQRLDQCRACHQDSASACVDSRPLSTARMRSAISETLRLWVTRIIVWP